MQKFFDTDIDFDYYKTYIWSDFHFGDRAVLKKRPMFQNIEDHDMHIVETWNEHVGEDDVGIILGDLGHYAETSKYLKMMNGTIIVVPGNHDEPNMLEKLLSCGTIDAIMGVSYIKPQRKEGVILSHVPIHESVLYGGFPVNVHGHLHHGEVLKHDFTKDHRYINVCIEQQMDKPFLLSDIMGL